MMKRSIPVRTLAAQLERAFLVFILVIGLCQPFGMLFGLSFFNAFGRSWGFSPSPVPFSHFNGYEVQKHKITFKITFKDPTVPQLEKDVSLFDSFSGPDLRRTVFLVGLSNAPAIGEKIVTGLLRTIFCHQGAFKKEIKYSSIAKIEYIIQNEEFSPPKEYSIQVRCSGA